MFSKNLWEGVQRKIVRDSADRRPAGIHTLVGVASGSKFFFRAENVNARSLLFFFWGDGGNFGEFSSVANSSFVFK